LTNSDFFLPVPNVDIVIIDLFFCGYLKGQLCDGMDGLIAFTAAAMVDEEPVSEGGAMVDDEFEFNNANTTNTVTDLLALGEGTLLRAASNAAEVNRSLPDALRALVNKFSGCGPKCMSRCLQTFCQDCPGEATDLFGTSQALQQAVLDKGERFCRRCCHFSPRGVSSFLAYNYF
jgi:hypothetical protein